MSEVALDSRAFILGMIYALCLESRSSIPFLDLVRITSRVVGVEPPTDMEHNALMTNVDLFLITRKNKHERN